MGETRHFVYSVRTKLEAYSPTILSFVGTAGLPHWNAPPASEKMSVTVVILTPQHGYFRAGRTPLWCKSLRASRASRAGTRNPGRMTFRRSGKRRSEDGCGWLKQCQSVKNEKSASQLSDAKHVTAKSDTQIGPAISGSLVQKCGNVIACDPYAKYPLL